MLVSRIYLDVSQGVEGLRVYSVVARADHLSDNQAYPLVIRKSLT